MANMARFKLRGFTLIEMILVVVIISILSAVSARVLNAIFTSYFRGQDLINADSEARVALRRVSIDLHNLRSTADITTASASVLTFTDLNGNAISYQLNASQLVRNNLALAKNTQSIVFQYYDAAGILLVAPVSALNIPLIRYIKLTLVINSFTYTIGVTLWNTL